MTLQDLSRELPSKTDQIYYLTYLHSESDRGAAIMAAAFVERTLEDQIRLNIQDPGGGVADSWFEGINAPFGTFSAKIALGRALGLYNDEIQSVLTVIKNVRNAFAHRSLPLKFDHPTVLEECKFLCPEQVRDKENDARHIFTTCCLTMIRLLGRKAVGFAHLEAAGMKAPGE